MNSKKDIRRLMRRRRQSLSRRDRIHSAVRIAAVVGAMREFRGARRIGIFAANDGEIDLGQTVKCYPCKDYFLPVVPPSGTRRMRFAAIGPETSFRKNRYGILEPDVPKRSLLTARELDLVLAPLVAFDRFGGRIGMGGGYYDTTFAFLASRNHWQHPKMVGVAFSFQEAPHIDPDPWDIALTAVATERGVVVTI